MSWPMVKLGDIFEIARGGSPRPIDDFITDSDDGLNWISIKDASNSNKYINSTKLKIKPEGLSKTRMVHPGDFLLTNSMSFGRPYIMNTSGCIHDGWLVLSGNPEIVDSDYFYFLLGSETLKQRFTELAAGAVVKNLNSELVRSVEIPLPPLAEQKRIAAILDKADAIRRKRQQAIQLADDFLRAVFLEMFGDPVTNPKGWETKTIEQIISEEKYALKRGPFGGALKKEIFVDEGYLVYEQYHALNGDFSYQRYFIDETKFQELKAFEVKPKDIIVSCSGVNLGRLAEVPSGSPSGIINQALMKITLNQSVMLNELFIDIFSNPSFKTAFYGDFRGAAIPNFPPMATFREFRFIVPPLELQQKYVCIKNKLSVHSDNSKNMDNLDLFNALSQKAFSGQL